MPLDNLLPGLSIATGLASSAIGAATTARQNEKQRAYEMAMYDKQKKDQIAFWNMQNQYNLPIMQMERLKQAGLNPNLAYGEFKAGNAGPLSAPDPKVTASKPVNLNLPNLSDIYAIKQQQAQIDLMRQQTITQDSVAKLNYIKAQTEFWTAQLKAARAPYERETAKQELDNLRYMGNNLIKTGEYTSQMTRTSFAQEQNYNAITQKTIDSNMRDWQLNKITLAKMTQEILNLRKSRGVMDSQINLNNKNAANTEVLKDIHVLDYVFARTGFSKNDNVVQRGIKNILSLITKNKEKAKQEIEKLKDYIENH